MTPCLRTFTFIACAFALAAAIVSPGAQAAAVSRISVTNAVGACQAALPAFEGLIRKRPLAVQNEGTATAFVSCAYTSTGNNTEARIRFHSVDGLPHSVSCTGIVGSSGFSTPVVKTTSVPAAGQGEIGWVATDFVAGASYLFGGGRFSTSCAIGANVGIDELLLFFNEDVGD